MVKNKKAHLEYSFDYEIEAGIVLKSDEVKSMRLSSPSLQGAYCYISQHEIFIKNLNLNKSANPKRDKKLLLHKKQINKVLGIFSQKCYVIIPLELYEKNGIFKILIAAGKHLNKHDKREVLKEKDMKHTMQEIY